MSRRTCFAVFGLRGPLLGPGAAGDRPRMKNCVGWTPGGVRGPILSGFRSGVGGGQDPHPDTSISELSIFGFRDGAATAILRA